MRLGELKKGQVATISKLTVMGDLAERFMSMGLLEGSRVELVHEAPFGGDPVAVRVRGALIAMRRGEANHIEVVVHE